MRFTILKEVDRLTASEVIDKDATAAAAIGDDNGDKCVPFRIVNWKKCSTGRPFPSGYHFWSLWHRAGRTTTKRA